MHDTDNKTHRLVKFHGEVHSDYVYIGDFDDDAFKNLVDISGAINGTTINHDIQNKYNASVILLKPASEGTGTIAGGAVRPVLELAGIKDILTKSLGSNEPHNLVRATIDALTKIKTKRS